MIYFNVTFTRKEERKENPANVLFVSLVGCRLYGERLNGPGACRAAEEVIKDLKQYCLQPH